MVSAQNYDHSFEKVSRIKKPISDPTQLQTLQVQDITQIINYKDQIGRPLQSIAKQASPNQRDIVKFFEYDNAGRTVKNHLGYVDQTDNGYYKTGVKNKQKDFYLNQQGIAHTSRPYAVIKYENSPLSRITEVGSEGWYWQPGTDPQQGHTKRMSHKLNSASQLLNLSVDNNGDLILNTGKYISANKLYYQELMDENDKLSGIFSDQYGKQIAKISYGENSNPDLITYYVYNIYDQLSYIIPPALAAEIDQNSHSGLSWTNNLIKDFAYAFRYDEKHRLIEKLEPGSDPIYFVYDNFNRLILQQDGNQRENDQWKFIKYDNLSRPVILGVQKYPEDMTREQVQNLADNFYLANSQNFEYLDFNYQGHIFGYSDESYPLSNSTTETLIVNYYDDYSFDQNNDYGFDDIMGTVSPIDSPNGLLTASVVKILENGTSNYLYNVYFYDDKYQMIQSTQENILAGYDRVYNYFKFDGTLEWSEHKHVIYENQTNEYVNSEVKVYNYDHAGRNTSMHYRVGATEFKMYANSFNELGRLVEKNIFEETTTHGTSALQSIDYKYNIRGWLKNINYSNLTNDNSVLDFSELLAPNERVSGLVVDTIIFKASNYDGQSAIPNLTIDIEDRKKLEISEIQDPSNKSYESLNESKTFVVYENLVSQESFAKLLTQLNIKLTFDMSQLTFNEYDSRQMIADAVALEVANSLRNQGILDQVLVDAIITQVQDYFYNIIGIVFFNEDQDDIFGMDILYNEGFSELSGEKQFNGLISGIKWQSIQSEGIRGYGFGYDEHYQFTQANYGDYAHDIWDANNHYSVSNITYDLNGNIQSLKRNGKTGENQGVPVYGVIDDLDYNYNSNANQLETVDDNSGFLGLQSKDFKDNGSLQQTEYTYDKNGNLLNDKNKSITNISYNILNKPVEVIFSDGKKLTFLYDAAGRKLKDKVYDQSSTLIKEKSYTANYHYFDNQGTTQLDYLLTEEGRMIPDVEMRFTPEFFFRDYLGNIREIYKKGLDGRVEIVEEHHYYPFGMTMGGLDSYSSPLNPFQYQGKQFIDDYNLNWHYFHARMFDSQLGRWHCKDPVIVHASPYIGMGNNPVSLVDPDGRTPGLGDDFPPGNWLPEIEVIADGNGSHSAKGQDLYNITLRWMNGGSASNGFGNSNQYGNNYGGGGFGNGGNNGGGSSISHGSGGNSNDPYKLNNGLDDIEDNNVWLTESPERNRVTTKEKIGFIINYISSLESGPLESASWLSEAAFAIGNMASFATGLGSSVTTYGPDSDAVKAIRQSPGIQIAINKYLVSQTPTPNYPYKFSPDISSVDAFINTIGSSVDAHLAAIGSPIQLFIGSYNVFISPYGANHINVTVTNKTGLNSLFYHLPTAFGFELDYNRSGVIGMPYSSIKQIFYWTQPLNE